MDTQGVDTTDAAGMPEDKGSRSRPKIPPQSQSVQDVITSYAIHSEEFHSAGYKICPKAGKAVIVSNFMGEYNPRPSRQSKDPECRGYASKDCEDLEFELKRLGFEPLSGDEQNGMVYKNLTNNQLTDLYKRAAKEDYRPKDGQGYTCVLFIVMSYGRSGLIKCHAEDSKGHHEYVEQKNIQEAFQPQNSHSLALKPKIFIIQTIPEQEDMADDIEGQEVKTTKRIPREADFLTYSCDSYCLKTQSGSCENIFARSIVSILRGIAEDKDNGKPAMEIQRIFIRMNKHYKEKRTHSNWKIPCVTSSLTKQLILF